MAENEWLAERFEEHRPRLRAVTSIGMFSGGAGYGLTLLTLKPLELIVGGIGHQARVVDGQVVVRDVLNPPSRSTTTPSTARQRHV